MDVIRKKLESQGKMRIFTISTFTFLFVCFGLLSPLVGQDDNFQELFNIIAAQDLDNSTPGLYNRSEWSRDWNNPPWENGLGNIYIADEQGERVMKFTYPEGTWHPFEGGAQWLAPFEKGLQEVYFSYNVMFKPGFEWVLGGKMPGLGGGNNVGGGRDMLWDDGFSARIMWNRDSGGDGTMFFYVYHQDKPGYYGDVLQFQDAYWDVSDYTWYNMTMRLVVNSIDQGRLTSDPQNAGNKDGILEFFLDGKLVYSRTNMRFRNLENIYVDTRHITSFFGGTGDEWGAARDEWVLFDDLVVYNYQESVDVPHGREPSPWGRVLDLPNLKGDTPDPGDLEAPSIPQNVRLTNATGQSLSIAWNPSTDNVFLKGYRVLLNGNEVGTSAGTSYTFSDLLSNTSYNIAISAFDASGNESLPSEVLEASTLESDTVPPSVPAGLFASDHTQVSVQVSWTASTDNVAVSEYRIYLDGDWIGSTPVTTFSLAGLEEGSTYMVSVTALDAFLNESAASDVLEVRTLDPDREAPSKPLGLTATLVTQNSIGLTWNPSSDNVGVVGYRVYLNTALASSTSSNSFTLTGLNSGIEYSIRVLAYDAALNVSLSSDIIKVSTRNPDETTAPTLPDVEIVELETISSFARMKSVVNAYGHTALKDFGVVISSGTDSAGGGHIYYASQEETEVNHAGRIEKNLQVLYDFTPGPGNKVLDVSGKGNPIDLVIVDPLAVDWLPGQGISIKGSTSIYSEEKPVRLIDSLMESNEISMEAWIRSDKIFQDGPARIISISKDNFHRAATLAYEGNNAFYNYVARLNTSTSDVNGTPQLSTNQDFLSLNFHHVVYTRAQTGVERIFVNGVELISGIRSGDFSTMTDDYLLSLSNEIGGERPWLGAFYLAAIYNRALSSQEVMQNFEAGPGQIQYNIEVPVEPNHSYDLSPFARTDQGVVYGDAKSLEVKNVLQRPEGDSVYIAIYPNPSNGNFKVFLEYPGIEALQVSIRITDMSGRLIYLREINESDEFVRIEESFELSSFLQNGIYVVMLVVGSRSIASRLIIQG